MSRADVAVELFTSGFSCSQAVLAASCDVYTMDKKTALRISAGFGGGAKTGEICGAISGALMVIGMHYGQVDATDMEARHFCAEKVKEFQRLFQERHGHITCRDLLQDLQPIEEGRPDFEHKVQIKSTRCTKMVRDCIEILDQLGC